MTNKEAISIMNVIIHMLEPQYDTERVEDAVSMAIKELEQQPCDDAISREAVKDMLNEEWIKYMPMDLDINLSFVLKKISELPSVTPTRPKGRWLEQKDIHKHHYGWFFCSECGAFLMSSDGANYCSCCGAKMEVDG